jgi:hypothetical protein
MKRKITTTLTCLAVASGSWTCWLIAQDPFNSAPAVVNSAPAVVNSAPAVVNSAPAVAIPADLASPITIASPSTLAMPATNALPSGTTIQSTRAGNYDRYTVNNLSYAQSSQPREDQAQAAEIRKLAQSYTETEPESSKKEIASKISALVAKQFDSRQEAKQQELIKLEEQLAKLKELHGKRAKQKDRIVGDRVQQILLEADGLGWGTSENNSAWLNPPFGPATVGVIPFSASAGGFGATIAPAPAGPTLPPIPPRPSPGQADQAEKSAVVDLIPPIFPRPSPGQR